MVEESRRSRLRHIFRQAVVLAALFMVVWLPRVLTLDRYVTIDEHDWLTNTAKFYRALYERDFAGTYRIGHPGVTVMWAGTAGLLWDFPEYASESTGKIGSRKYEQFLAKHGHRAIDLLVKSRLCMTLGNTVILVLSYVFARRLIGQVPAFVGFLFIALDPFYIAHTQLLHLDGMLSCLILLSLLSFLNYIRTQQHVSLIVSSVSAGLSWLTKSPGLFLIPVIGLLLLISGWKDLTDRRNTSWSKWAWQKSRLLLVWVGIATIVFVALWPAMWVAPLNTISQMVNTAFVYAERGHESPVFFNGKIYSDGKLGPTFYPISYLWHSTPVMLAGLVAGVLIYVIRRKQLPSETHPALAGLVLFIVVFAVQLSLGSKKFDRYLLPIYAPLALVSAIGWTTMVRRFTERFHTVPKSMLSSLLLGIAVALHGVAALQVFPYYLSYYDPLMGGPTKAAQVLTIGWGEGLDQAAEYLNAKPNASELRVVSWYRPCFSYFFVGKSMNIDNSADLSEEHLHSLLDADYMVIYIHQWQRYIPKSLMDYLYNKTPERTIELNDLEYVQIFRLGSN